jgi:hypothetical protein
LNTSASWGRVDELRRGLRLWMQALYEEFNRGELTVEQTARKVGFKLPTVCQA